MSKRITMRDIAKKAGLHFSTVSRALSNHPSIPSETCRRIQEIALKLGYSPDPMLSALTVYRSSQRKSSYRGTIAWVTNAATRDGWRKLSYTFVRYMQGAQKKADELGYNLEEFWLKEPGITSKRASDILYARNVRGLLLPPQTLAKVRIKLDWSRFAAVTFGFTLAWPQLHSVATNTFFSMQLAVRHARSLGYRRIGLIMNKFNDLRINHGWLGGYLVIQNQWPMDERIPVCEEHASNPEAILAWVKRYSPDAIINHDDHICQILRNAEYRIPQDIGFISPTTMAHAPEISGIDEQPELTGSTAASLLIGMINRGEWGIPQSPLRVFTEGVWFDGETVLRKNLSSA